jgi:hypothetical protein
MSPAVRVALFAPTGAPTHSQYKPIPFSRPAFALLSLAAGVVAEPRALTPRAPELRNRSHVRVEPIPTSIEVSLRVCLSFTCKVAGIGVGDGADAAFRRVFARLRMSQQQFFQLEAAAKILLYHAVTGELGQAVSSLTSTGGGSNPNPAPGQLLLRERRQQWRGRGGGSTHQRAGGDGHGWPHRRVC